VTQQILPALFGLLSSCFLCFTDVGVEAWSHSCLFIQMFSASATETSPTRFTFILQLSVATTHSKLFTSIVLSALGLCVYVCVSVKFVVCMEEVFVTQLNLSSLFTSVHITHHMSLKCRQYPDCMHTSRVTYTVYTAVAIKKFK